MLQIFQNKNIIEALSIITGGKSGGYYLAGLFFSALAISLSLYLHSKKRDPASPNTPEKFSLLFLLWDNFKRAMASFILMFIIFRVFDCSNVMAMIGVGFFIALGIDKAIQWLMEKTDFMNFLKTNRENFPQKPAQ
jgi:hypothetical protein